MLDEHGYLVMVPDVAVDEAEAPSGNGWRVEAEASNKPLRSTHGVHDLMGY